MRDFKKSLKDGGFGECIVWDYLQKLPKVRQVIDVRNDLFFQQKDVDFLVENYDRQMVWVEVKTDYQAQDTGNIVYEKSTSGNIGCFEKTEAKFIYYYLPVITTLYVISVAKLRWFVDAIKPPLKKMGDYAEGYLLNIETLKEYKVIIGEEQL